MKIKKPTEEEIEPVKIYVESVIKLLELKGNREYERILDGLRKENDQLKQQLKLYDILRTEVAKADNIRYKIILGEKNAY